MESYLEQWLRSEHAERFRDVADQIRDHDQSCRSLQEVWLPHVGGRSCPQDIHPCSKCRLVVFNEGLVWEDILDERLFDGERALYHWCHCCYDAMVLSGKEEPYFLQVNGIEFGEPDGDG